MKTEPELPPTSPQKLNVKACLATVAIILVVVACLIANHDSQKARVSEWAGRNGYTIVGEVRTRSLLEPCPFLLNGEHVAIFRADLEDAGHRRRTAWFRFGLAGLEQAWE